MKVKRLPELLIHPWLNSRVQIGLGLIFIIAAAGKIADPPAFAKAIWAYQLFPAWSVHPLALALPWLEMLCGLALFFGVWVRAAASWIGTLLLSFVIALSINVARKHPVDCGCFGPDSIEKSESEKLNDMKIDILRDLGMLLLVVQILATDRLRSGRQSVDQ